MPKFNKEFIKTLTITVLITAIISFICGVSYAEAQQNEKILAQPTAQPVKK